MLEDFGLTQEIFAFNGDNATSNDTQTTKLDQLPNSFAKKNCACCFNHMLQLFAKTLLRPFNTALSGKDNNNNTPENLEGEVDEDAMLKYDEGQGEEDEQGEDESDDKDDEIDELQELGEVEQARLLEDTAAVRDMVTKVTCVFFANSVIH